MDLHLFHAISPIKVTRKLTLNIGEGGCEHLLTNFIKTYKFWGISLEDRMYFSGTHYILWTIAWNFENKNIYLL